MKITVGNFDEVMDMNLWGNYKKVIPTRAYGPFKVKEAITIVTGEADYHLPVGWTGYIVEDEDGNRYPLHEDAFSAAYTKYLS